MILVDQDNRRRAMTDFTSVLLVEAAAGTGKTSLMAGRIAMMLANGYEPGEIAAITFTELAASQLARRIKDAVDALLLNDIPAFIQPVLPEGRLTDAQRASLASAATRLDDLTATTIHGFCQAILHTHGVQAGLDPGARVVDAPVADALFLSELSAWLSRRLAADATADDPIVVLAQEIPLEVVGLIRELAILRRKHPDAAPIPPVSNARPDITFVQAVDDFDRWQSSAEHDKWAHAIAQELRKLAARYADTFIGTPDFAALWKLCDAGRTRLFGKGLQLISYDEAAQRFGAYHEETGGDDALARYQVVTEAWNELVGHIANCLVCALSSSLDQLLTGYRDSKRAAAVLDFDDLLLHVRDLVRCHDDVRQAIGRRLDMRDSRVVRDYDDRLKEYRRIRKQLADYIDLITTEFGDSGLTVHAILGKSIATNDRLAGISNDTLERCKLGSETQTKSGFAVLSQLGFQIESAHAGTLAANKHWQKTRLVHPDRFTVEEACALASRASTEALTLNQAREALTPWSLDPNGTSATLEGLAQFLAGSSDLLQHHPKDLLIAVLTDGKASALSNFLSGCTAMVGAGEQLAVELSEDPDENALHKVKKVEEICLRASLPTIASGDLADLLEARKKAAGAARAVAAALQPLVQACEAARTWLLDDLVKAQALYREAGREAMALRSPRLADGNAAHHLRKLCDEGIGLQRERSALSERITLTAEISVESLIECVSTLRTAGTFAFLSPRYRNAKKRFRSISRSPSYSKADAIRCLDDVIAFRRKSGEFIKQAEANKLFGMYYRGLDTEFEPFARLAGFCEALAKHFSGPKHVTLQKFLREATVGHLDLMPAWPPTNIGITFDSLGDRITNTTNEVRVLETAIADLHNVADVFRDPNADIASIRSAKARLEELLSERTKLDTHGVARELLRDHFKGHRTAAARFEGLVAWAQSAQLMASMVQRVLGAGSPIHAGEIIAAVLSAEANLSVTLARMSDVAKINPSAFMEGRSLAQAAELLAKAAGDSEGLFAFAGFAGALQDAGPQGIMPLVEERTRGGSLQGLGAQIEALAVRQLAKAVFAQYGNKLSRFRGTKLDELRTELAQKDKEIIQLSRKQLRAKVKTVARPPGGNGMGKKSTWTDMALIDNEVSKKQRFIAVRDLTQRAGRALLELKPCWMMSPLRAMGCKPVPQVGVAGYFVDIGIRHPDWPHGFLMGVECDGATYHSAKSARDRDRLRQEILEGLGWNLHRIWSTDWFNNPQQQADRLRKAVSERLAFLKAREHEFVQPQKAQSVPAPAKPAPVAQIAELFDFEAPVAPSPPKPAPNIERRVEIGDTVRVRYLTDDQRTVKITISKTQSDPSRGIVHHGTPVASALLGAEEGDEVEVLVGSYIRPAIIETITKAG